MSDQQDTKAHGPLDEWAEGRRGSHDPRTDDAPQTPENWFQGTHVLEATRERVIRLATYKMPVKEIAREVRVSPSRVYQILQEDRWPTRERRFPLLTKEEADRLAQALGGYSRLKHHNGRGYYYAVKNEWVPATSNRRGRVKQHDLGYLGPQDRQREPAKISSHQKSIRIAAR